MMTDERRGPSPHGPLHLATDHLLEPTLSVLSGSDVVLSGTKSDGTAFSGRTLANVSFRPSGHGAIHVIGMDPEAGGLAFERGEVLAMLDRAIHELTRRSEGGDR